MNRFTQETTNYWKCRLKRIELLWDLFYPWKQLILQIGLCVFLLKSHSLKNFNYELVRRREKLHHRCLSADCWIDFDSYNCAYIGHTCEYYKKTFPVQKTNLAGIVYFWSIDLLSIWSSNVILVYRSATVSENSFTQQLISLLFRFSTDSLHSIIERHHQIY